MILFPNIVTNVLLLCLFFMMTDKRWKNDAVLAIKNLLPIPIKNSLKKTIQLVHGWFSTVSLKTSRSDVTAYLTYDTCLGL